MFLYKNQRLHAHGICFALPDNFFLCAAAALEQAASLELEAADGSYTVTVGIDEQGEGTQATLLDLISAKGGMTPLGPVTPVTLAGFAGHCLKYRGSREEYFELRLALGQDVEFYLYAATQSSGIDDVMASAEMTRMLQQIERSEV